MEREQDPVRREPRADGGSAAFVLGMLAGVLLALILLELWPSSSDVQRYVEVRDFARESFVREVSDEELLDHALHGMLIGLDEYSRYYDREEAAALTRETEGRYRGVGIVFRRPVREGRVLYPLADSPASRAGVRVGDAFETLEGRAVSELSEAEFRALLAAPEGDQLEVELRGLDGERRTVVITPESIVDPSVRHVRILDRERGIGYIAITSFSGETHQEFDRAFEFLKQRGMQALVLDVRRNFGGVLEAAVRVARRFIEKGTIVSTEGRGEPVVYRADPDAAWHVGTPLVVLVDGDSASASEVLAGALQDHRAAVLVGEPTYGKGMVQTIRTFDERGTRAKVTSSYYYSPTRRNFERSADPDRDYGILPDVEIPLLREERLEVHSFLQSYSPPLEAIPALEEWSAQASEQLIDSMPLDAQLSAAVALLCGERPGPHPIQR